LVWNLAGSSILLAFSASVDTVEFAGRDRDIRRFYYSVVTTTLEFQISGIMESKTVILALGALAQETRLAIFRMLVKRGPEGFTPGDIAERLSIPAATLSFHLKELQTAQLTSTRREGRFVYYSANIEHMNTVLAFLTDNCCSLSSTPRDAACVPKATARKKRA
jgi:ArsR family transcriptional regulator, arsenate/arsenite/antimonite-responsive transcriptional repressor